MSSLRHSSLVFLLLTLACAGGKDKEDEEGEDTSSEGTEPVTCLELDRLDGYIVPPAGISLGFRVRDCDGNAVRGLRSEDIVVINDEDGLPFDEGEGGAVAGLGVISDVEMYSVLTLDFSSSIFDAGAEEDVVDGALAYIDATLVAPDYPLDHQIALIAFGGPTEIEVIADFTDDPNELQRALSQALSDGSRGTTDLYNAYMYGLSLVANEGSGGAEDAVVEKFVVVMTDGTHEAGDSANLRSQALEAQAQSEATIYAIGIEGDYDAAALQELASSPANFIPVDGSSDLGDAFEETSQLALALAQSNYVVGICTPVALGNPTLTLHVTVDEATASESISYPTDDLTGAIDDCDPEVVAAVMGG